MLNSSLSLRTSKQDIVSTTHLMIFGDLRFLCGDLQWTLFDFVRTYAEIKSEH